MAGSRTRSAKWSPQDVVQDSHDVEREKHQIKVYFNNLADVIGDAVAIALFAPSAIRNTESFFIGGVGFGRERPR